MYYILNKCLKLTKLILKTITTLYNMGVYVLIWLLLKYPNRLDRWVLVRVLGVKQK